MGEENNDDELMVHEVDERYDTFAVFMWTF
jgi:hypothetical protein